MSSNAVKLLNSEGQPYTRALPVPVALGPSLVASDPYRRALVTNSPATSFDAMIPAIALAGHDYIECVGRQSMLALLFGAGADDATFDYRWTGWQKIGGLWVGTVICQGTATLSAVVGIAGQEVVATDRFADTIDIDAGIGINTNAPAANACPATLEFDVGPYDWVKLFCDMTGATNGNALYTTF